MSRQQEANSHEGTVNSTAHQFARINTSSSSYAAPQRVSVVTESPRNQTPSAQGTRIERQPPPERAPDHHHSIAHSRSRSGGTQSSPSSSHQPRQMSVVHPNPTRQACASIIHQLTFSNYSLV